MMEPVSIDEAYADVTGCTTLFGPPQVIARKIKHLIFNDLSLTCSIGIAPVKFLAKIASDMNKPDGLTFITREQMPQMILTLPIRKVPGVGKQAMARMTELNIQTLGDIQRFGLSLLTRKFGKFGHRLFELSRGIDNDPVRTETTRKSISNEITLEKDISDAGAAQRILLSLAGRVGRELRQKQLTSESVFIKIKFSDFTQITRTRKLQNRTGSTEAIFSQARDLFGKVNNSKPIRLLGVGVSHLHAQNEPVQLDLVSLPDHESKKQWESVDRAMDCIYEKFGRDMVTPAVLRPLTTRSPKAGGNMSDTVTKKVTISGKVQGVYYRLETQKAAQTAKVTGYVKNLANGSVEAVFQGTAEAVARMVDWCRHGPPAARVIQVIEGPPPAQIDFIGFEIRY